MRKLIVALIIFLYASPSFAEDRLAWGGSLMIIGSSAGEQGGNPAFVNAWKDIDGGTGGTAAISVATTGNLVAVWLATGSGASDDAFVTSDVDGSFTKIISIQHAASARGTWFYLKNATSGAHTITYNGGTGGSFTDVIIYEISGVSTTAPFTAGEYATSVFSSTTTNPFTANLLNATANSIFLAGFSSSAISLVSIDINGTNTVPAAGWSEHANSEQEDATSVMHSGTAYYVASSSSTRAHGWTVGDSLFYVTAIVCFH